jgi:hypothetical protein
MKTFPLLALCMSSVALSSVLAQESDYEKALRENSAKNRALTDELNEKTRQAERDKSIADFEKLQLLRRQFTRALDGHDIEAMRRARDALTEEEERQAKEALLKFEYSH